MKNLTSKLSLILFSISLILSFFLFGIERGKLVFVLRFFIQVPSLLLSVILGGITLYKVFTRGKENRSVYDYIAITIFIVMFLLFLFIAIRIHLF